MRQVRHVRTLSIGYQPEGFYHNRGRGCLLGWQKYFRGKSRKWNLFLPVVYTLL